MSKKCSLWAMNQPLSSIDTDLNTIKLTSMKDDKQNQCKYLSIDKNFSSFYDIYLAKNQEKIEKSSSMSSNADVLPLVSE